MNRLVFCVLFNVSVTDKCVVRHLDSTLEALFSEFCFVNNVGSQQVFKCLQPAEIKINFNCWSPTQKRKNRRKTNKIEGRSFASSVRLPRFEGRHHVLTSKAHAQCKCCCFSFSFSTGQFLLARHLGKAPHVEYCSNRRALFMSWSEKNGIYGIECI